MRDGGCLCGAVRYRVRGAPRSVVHCHCAICRRASGAPVVTWAIFPHESFEITAGAPAVIRSSAHAERTFCARCGSPIGFRDDRRPDWIDVTVATLDDAAALPPTGHVWTESRLPWFDTADHLPRLPRGSGDDA
jgi:hypothetical protein